MIPSLRRLKQKIASLRPAWATLQIPGHPEDPFLMIPKVSSDPASGEARGLESHHLNHPGVEELSQTQLLRHSNLLLFIIT
jgi:hypothetical protein